METKTGNKNQTDFSAIGPTIFELWVMETELWVIETAIQTAPELLKARTSILF